jgi:nucleoside-diphosphate-sugar epimerase
VRVLLERGFNHIRCLVRSSHSGNRLVAALKPADRSRVEIFRGNLLAPADCAAAARDVAIVYHLAAGTDKSFAGAFMNSALTTRNLLDALTATHRLKRFVNVSSFAVYSNRRLRRGALLDETCGIETPAHARGEAYCYGKIKQDELVAQYGRDKGLPYVIVRPGTVYGPGFRSITGRVGVSTFGIFLHLGGPITLPLSYVDNCAEAIALAGMVRGVDGEVINIVDDELLTSREFLRSYKRHVQNFRSLRVPYPLTYLLCLLWEKYSTWSEGQVPPVFNRSRCSAEWKGNRYSNDKARRLLGWAPRVGRQEAMRRYLEYQKATAGDSPC